MTTTRRSVLAGGLATAAMTSAPAIIKAQAQPSAARTLKAVMHADLRVLDPIWTTANISAYHGAMIYDTLFGIDDKFTPQPQMVSKWGVSDDKLTYTFELRDGLKFSDGAAMTAADCVASVRRWAARSGGGQTMMKRVKDTPVVDDKTFKIVLSEPYGLVIESLSTISTSLCYMMRRKDAETDPNQQIRETIGSGPFLYNRDETRPGNRHVYDRNPNYVPRAEPPSAMAGGKVVKLDRVEWIWIPDAETQLNALMNGEIDMVETVSYDHLPILEKNKDVRLIPSPTSNQYVFRPNWLQPPFNNVKVRQAAAYALNQEEFLQANIGDNRFYRVCKAMFTCDSPLATTAGTEGLMEGNVAKARELLKEAGYDGTVVVMPQPTDLGVIKQLAPVAKSQLEKAGFKVDVQPMDWQSMVTRLISNKGAPSAGGWSAFGTSWVQVDILDPLMTPNLAATCDKARAGWPCDEAMEKLRDKFVAATTEAEKKAVAEEVQRYALQIVTHVPLGEWFAVSAVRSNVGTPAVPPLITIFWDVTKN